MLNKIPLALLFFACSFLLAAAPAGRFEPQPQGPRYCKTDPARTQVLFENGQANFEVVCGKSSGAQPAAEELVGILEQALGVKLPLRKSKSGKVPALLVGDLDAAKAAGFDPDEMEWGAFRIKSVGNDIILAGKDDSSYSDGTFYAVYDFLERFVGVRFYFPGDVGTIVPKLEKWSVPGIDLADRPDMQTRTMFSADPFVNNFQGGGPVRWYDETPGKSGSLVAQRRNRIQVRSPFQSCHGLAHLALRERFAETHPEYFALSRQNVRITGDPNGAIHKKYGHICYSSEGLKEELVLDAKAIQTGKDGSTRGAFHNGKPAWPNWDQTYGFFNVMPNDSAYWCQCPKCGPAFADLKGNKISSQAASDLTWTFMTDIARKLKEDKVPGYVLTMAYAHYREVPSVEIPDNMLVMVAQSGPWAEFTPRKITQQKNLKAWHKKLGARPYIWNYATKFSAKIPLVPNWTPRAIGRYYGEVGDDIFGAFLEAETDYWIFGFMNYYLFGRLMWDKKADAEAILAEHYKLMYGAAAPEMTAFFDLLEDIWMHHIVGRVTDSPEGPVSIRPSEHEVWNEIYSPAIRAKLDELLRDAAAKCANDPDSLKRIAFMRREFYDRLRDGAELYAKSAAEVEEWKGYMPALKAGEKLLIDGRDEESAWKHAPAYFLLPNSTVKSEAISVRTSFKALRDNSNFYFFVECEEPETDRMTAIIRKPDEFELCEDNTVEIFLNPSCDRVTGYQMLFNSAGCLADNTFKLKAMNWKWNSNAEYKVSVTPGKKWCLEVRIPRESMEKCSERLIANVMRSRVIAGERFPFDTWSPKVGESTTSQYIEGFGSLEFEPPTQTSVLPGGDFTEPVWSERFLGKHEPFRWYSDRPLVKDTKIFRTGGSSIRMDSDASYGLAFWDLRGFVKPGTRYRLSFFIKTQNIQSLMDGGVYVLIKCGMKPPKTLLFPPGIGRFFGTMPWTRQSFEFTTPEEFGRDGRPELSFYLISRNGKKGIAWVDQVELHELNEKQGERK